MASPKGLPFFFIFKKLDLAIDEQEHLVCQLSLIWGTRAFPRDRRHAFSGHRGNSVTTLNLLHALL